MTAHKHPRISLFYLDASTCHISNDEASKQLARFDNNS
jgi:hypothetical protein